MNDRHLDAAKEVIKSPKIIPRECLGRPRGEAGSGEICSKRFLGHGCLGTL